MAISTHIYVKHPDLALTHTIRSLPDARIGVLPDAGTDPHHDEYLFWVEAPDFDALEEVLVDDRSVANFSLVAESEKRRTYRIEYSEEAKLLTPMIVDMGGLTQEVRSHVDGWILRLQLHGHDALVSLDNYAEERDIHLEILDLQQNPDVTSRLNYGLTESQVEALVAAYVHGYYDEPREISLEGLASTLGISNTAVGGRIRRGSARLIEEVLIDDERD